MQGAVENAGFQVQHTAVNECSTVQLAAFLCNVLLGMLVSRCNILQGIKFYYYYYYFFFLQRISAVSGMSCKATKNTLGPGEIFRATKNFQYGMFLKR